MEDGSGNRTNMEGVNLKVIMIRLRFDLNLMNISGG